MPTPEKATLIHQDTIFNIFQECRSTMEKESIFQWTKQYPSIDILAQDIMNGHVFCIVGTITINTKQDPQYDLVRWQNMNERPLVIHRLAIKPEYQHQGLARKLMDYAEDYAKENAYTSIRFDAYSGNKRTIRFYENRGYEKKGEIYFPGRRLPFICFEKLLY